MRITSLLVLIMVLMFVFAGQSAYKTDIEVGEERDIYNFTESTLNWNYNLTNRPNTNIGNNTPNSEYYQATQRFQNVLYRFINFIGYSSFEGAKLGIEYGYTHPEHDLKFFLDFLIKILLIGIIIALIPLVIPFIALVYLSLKGIHCLIKKLTKKNETKNKKG